MTKYCKITQLKQPLRLKRVREESLFFFNPKMLFVVLTALFCAMAPSAHAQSSSAKALNDAKTNACFRYGEDLDAPQLGFTTLQKIYIARDNVFVDTPTKKYGYLKVSSKAPEVLLKKPAGVTVTGTDALYQQADDEGVLTDVYQHVRWKNVNKPLPIYRRDGVLSRVWVYAHSPKLPNQKHPGSLRSQCVDSVG
jgi:hypothetical protein